MVYKFKSKDKGLMVWKDGSIVATFVNGLFETTDLALASFLVQFEEITSLTEFVPLQPELPPNIDLPIEPIILEEAKTEEVATPSKKVSRK